jgi:hypothetical protein
VAGAEDVAADRQLSPGGHGGSRRGDVYVIGGGGGGGGGSSSNGGTLLQSTSQGVAGSISNRAKVTPCCVCACLTCQI